MEFLQKLEKFLDGRLETIDNQENSFRINFTFEGQPFVYEDIEDKGFKDKNYKAFLKAQTSQQLTLNFTEKGQSTRIRSEIFLASEIPNEPIQESIKVHVPNSLQDFNIHTNNPVRANKLLEEKKIAHIFSVFKNVDKRGNPFMSLAIIDGMVILEFHSAPSYKPNLKALRDSIRSVEDYLDTLLVVINKLNETVT
jgi:hypothetical protein